MDGVMTTLTENEAYAAMCIWEEVLNIPKGALPDRQQKIGTPEFRSEMLSLAKPINNAYEAIADQYGDCFDWEFIPAMLAMIDKEANCNSPISLSNDIAVKMAKTLID